MSSPTCPDVFSSSEFSESRSNPSPVVYSCPDDRSWLTYSPLLQQQHQDVANHTAAGSVVTIAVRDMELIDGCYSNAESLCSAFCTTAIYTDTGGSGRDIALWEAALSLLGLVILLTTLFVICFLRLLPGGRLAAVHRQLLTVYAAYYASRTVRILAWPAVRCLGRSVSITLDAALEFLETLTYGGLFTCFLAQSYYLRVRLGRPGPACQSPPEAASLQWKRRNGLLVELISLIWPLPVAIATTLLASRVFAPDQLAHLPTFDALMQLQAASYYTAIVRLPLAAVHLVSILLGLLSLRLSLRRLWSSRRRRPGRHRRCLLRFLRWSRTLTLVNALSGAYLFLDLLPPGLVPTASGARALRCAQLAANLLQSLLVTLPMVWLNRRLRRFAFARLRLTSQSLMMSRRHTKPQAVPLRDKDCCADKISEDSDKISEHSDEISEDSDNDCYLVDDTALVRCPLVAFLKLENPGDNLRHVDCEIDS